MDLWSRWEEVVAHAPAAPALLLPDGDVRAHGELWALAAAAGEALRRRGVGAGERVTLWAGNREETVLAYLGALSIGAVVVPMNLAYRRQEVSHLLADAEPRLLLVDPEQRATLAEIGDDALGGVSVLGLEELAAEARAGADALPPAAGAAPRGDDRLAMLLYTSGTTGRSKGAMLTHRNLLATMDGLRQAWRWSSDDRLLLTLPIFHTHGLVVGLLTALLSGASVMLRRRFDAAAVLAELSRGEATLFFGVPTMYVRLVAALRASEAPRPRGVRLFCSGSAPLAADLLLAFRELTGATILERYGMTETGMLLSNPYEGERRAGTVGMPLPGVSLRIVDRQGEDVADGEEGELVVRGDNVFAGYWRDEEKTRESFLADASGARWFQTGDLGRRDPQSGHVTLLGRSRELILRGGFNVYPREIEEVLAIFPGVREAAVVGRPDAEWGEVPVAYVAADGELDAAALLEFCGKQLARFKVPVAVHRVDALPRNAMGKVQKGRLPR